MSDQFEDKEEFTVNDRRRFANAGAETASTDSDQKASESAPADEPSTGGKSAESEADYQMPKIDFSTFIFSLNSSAYVQLGLLEEPGTGQKTRNLPLAKQTIDILGMLEDKTRGNLTPDEENMLRHILYDLRLLYVKEKG